MNKGIHQFVSNFSLRDAVGESALALQKGFISMGYDSKIFCYDCSEKLAGLVTNFQNYHHFSHPDNVLIIHYGMKLQSIEQLTKIKDKKILLYHNITPGEFFKNFAPWLVQVCQDSRNEVTRLRNHIIAAVGDSKYNSGELKTMGYKNIRTIPLAVDFKKYDVIPAPDIIQQYSSGNWSNWLFVGRISPNKKQEDLIKIFYYYQKYIQPDSRLFLVGHGSGMGLYLRYLKGLVRHLNLKHVHFTGSISQIELAALYKTADIFLIMSEHEGFCVPLLEAFYYGVPVIAFDSSAVRETLGGTGVLVKEKRTAEISSLADYLFKNSHLKESLISHQKQRLKDFEFDTIKNQWGELIESL